MITQTFDLNLIPASAPVVVHCDQYDKGTGRLVVNLYEDSVAYAPTGTAVIQGMKPDGKGFNYPASLTGNVVTANLTEQMTAVAGRVRCQIVVTESTGRTGSFAFILEVQKSALPSDADMSDSDYQIIEEAMQAVADAVTDAENYAQDAADKVQDAEAWATGERGGVPVASTDETYENNAEYYAQQAALYAQGALKYKGSCTFANIPTSGMREGDMWNIEDDFTTDVRFQEGAGKAVAAGSNIAWNGTKWDVLAMVKVGVSSFNNRTGAVMPQSGDYELTDLGDVDIANPTDGQAIVYDATSQKYVNGDVAVSDMTNNVKGIGKPDGITTEASSGVFSAKGVGIVADVNPNGTAYGVDWLYYTGTSNVITPESDKMYRVTVSGTAYLYYWNGTAYTMLASQGGGGGGASLIDITLAAYNALTPAEKADANKWYWINDLDGLSNNAIVIGTLAGLTDTLISSPTNGQVLTYDLTSGKWVNSNPTGGVSTLSELSDVSISSPANGQKLRYNGTKWVNYNDTLSSLSDTFMSSVSDKQILMYTNNKWVNYNLPFKIPLTATASTPIAVEAQGVAVRNYDVSTHSETEYDIIDWNVHAWVSGNYDKAIITNHYYKSSDDRLYVYIYNPNSESLSVSISFYPIKYRHNFRV